MITLALNCAVYTNSKDENWGVLSQISNSIGIITGNITGNITLCLFENEGIRFRISHSLLT